MDYNNEQAIYLQIADMICEKILSKDWVANERIPSVRELAVSFQVNPNTVMRTYNYLQEEEIIYNKRGIGYFLNEDAWDKTQVLKRNQFLNKELPKLIKTMDLLGYKPEELGSLIKKLRDENK